ncbi:MAG: DUF86 domain-containing protein [Thermodesulfovibrionales bacterium]|nr:DUF86 domain-containing protein [Thermodesulfovibrionales bacterium]
MNIKLIEDRLGLINQALFKLKRLASIPKDRFLSSEAPSIAESYLRRSLEAIFDTGRHIIAKTAGKAVVEYKEIPARLSELGIIPEEFAQRLRLMAGYRNRLVHFYHEVTDEEIYRIIQDNLTDIEEFLKLIKKFIEQYRLRI